MTTANGTTTHRSHFFDVSFSGTGDLFASVICGSRLNGFSTEEAAERAGKFLYDSIADTMNDDTAPNDGVNFEKFFAGADVKLMCFLSHFAEKCTKLSTKILGPG